MLIIEKENQPADVVKDVICDCCGKSCSTPNGFEFMKLNAYWGYDSGKDLQAWDAHLCEKCVDQKLNFIKFAITPFNPFTNPIK